jgi:TP901 family phage tail tape measure protein
MAEKTGNVSVALIPEANVAQWKKEVQAAVAKVGPVTVNVTPNVTRAAMVAFRQELQAKLDKMNFYVNVTPKISKAALRKTTRELNQYYKDKGNAPSVYLDPKFRMTDVRKSIVDLNKKLAAAGKPTIYIDVSTKDGMAARQAEVAAFQARTEAMEAATIERTKNRELNADRIVTTQKLALLKLEQRERERVSAIINKGLDATGVARYEAAVMRSLKVLGAAWATYATMAAAATTAAAAIAVVQFAKVEQAANSAAAVVAGQQFSDQLDAGVKKTDAAASAMLTLTKTRGRFIEQARKTAIATAFDTEEAALGLVALTQAGLDTEQALKGLDITSRFSQAGLIDLEKGTQLLVQAQTALGLTSKDATQNQKNMARVSDVLTKAQLASVGSLEEITTALNNRAAASFTQYGQEIETVIAVIAQFTQAGLNTRSAGEQAAIAIREVMRSATSRAPEAFEKMGIAVKNSKGELAEFTDILGGLAKVYFELPEADRVMFFKNLEIPEKSSAALRTLLQAEQNRTLKDTAAAFKKSEGLTNQIAELQMQSLSQRFAQFAESVQALFAISGSKAADNLGKFFASVANDVQSGTNSGLVRLASALGDQLNKALVKIIAGIQSPDFLPFITKLTQSLVAATKGFAGFFTGFARGLTGVEAKNQSFLQSMGNLAEALGRFTQENLPKLGEAFGKVGRFISEHRGVIALAAEWYVKMGIAVFALRRILAPLVIIFRALRAVWAVLTGRTMMALIAGLKTTTMTLSRLSVVGTVVIGAVTAIAGAFKGFYEGIKQGGDGRNGLLRFFKMLEVLLKPVGDALQFVFKWIFKVGEALGRFFGQEISRWLNDLTDLFMGFFGFIAKGFDLLGKAPKMGWAKELSKDIKGAIGDIDSLGNATQNAASKTEGSSQRIVKAVKEIDIAVSRPGVGKARNNLADTVLGGGNVQKSAEALRKELAKTGQAESAQFNARANRLAAQQRDYKSIEKILNRRLSGDVWAAITGVGVNPKEKQVTKGLADGQDKLAGAIERRVLAQAKSLQILAQTGTFSKETVEASLRQLDAALGRHGSKIKIPLTVSQESLDATKRKLEEVSKPRTATLTVIERIQKAGEGILNFFKAGQAAQQKSQLEAVVALAQTETAKLQTALGALKTALRRPAVEAVKGLVAVLMDVPRQLRNAFNATSPQIVQLGAGIGKTLAAGMRSEIQNVSKAGTDLGLAAMAGLGAGLTSGFNTVIRPLLKGFTEEIPKLKGPIAYDATLLQPAGTAIMGGFARGLESGFDNVRSWLKAVAPAIEESVPDNLMVERTGKFLVDWLRSGKTLNPEDAFGDLVPKVPDMMGGDIGPIDASLGFLHPTASLRDTTVMAQALAKMFGLTVTDIKRPGGTRTASGNISDHSMGWAADISGSMSNTDRMVAAIKGLFPSVIKQLIWRNKDVNRGFFVGDHMDHAHLAFRPAAGFSLNSGKLGVTPVMPGSGGKAGSSSVMQAIARAAAATGMPVALIKAIAKQESGFNPRAGSPAGAKGLMQLMPGTARGLGVRDIYDPFQNALGGARYIRSMLGMFKRLDYALAGYNAGPGAVRKFGGIPPYRETQNYVRAVMRYFQQFGGAFGGFRAQGGMVSPGSAYVVGERGRELFVPGQRGNVITNANLERLIKLMEEQERKGKKGVTYQNNMTVQSNSSDPRVVASLIDSHNRYSMSRLNL